MLGTPEDLLEVTDIRAAVTAAPGAAGSEVFPMHPSL